jgi:hypothetical protein
MRFRRRPALRRLPHGPYDFFRAIRLLQGHIARDRAGLDGGKTGCDRVGHFTRELAEFPVFFREKAIEFLPQHLLFGPTEETLSATTRFPERPRNPFWPPGKAQHRLMPRWKRQPITRAGPSKFQSAGSAFFLCVRTPRGARYLPSVLRACFERLLVSRPRHLQRD